MAFEMALQSAAPPDLVLAAIRENLREWRESKIPREVWDDGVLQVVGQVTPPRFSMRFDRRWQWGEGGDPLKLVGEVLPDGNGGSRVTARCGAPGYRLWIVIVFGLLLLWDLIDGHLSWGLVVTAAAFLMLGAWHDARVSRDDRNAAYLARRLEDAVKSATAVPER